MHPIRNGNSSNVTRLPAEVYDRPMPFALLQMVESQLGKLMATEPAAQPVAESDGQFLYALDTPYSRSQVGA
jgi:hypothetical protein